MKPHLNLALKQAIIASRRSQQRIAYLARIPPTQLSHIVSGRRAATPAQQRQLARVLQQPESALFPLPAVSGGLHG